MIIAVCDDNTVFLHEIKEKLRRCFADTTKIVEFESADEFVNSQIEPDYLFTDIEMPGMDGIELKEYMEINQFKTEIVILTSHDERMREAFGNRVIGFLSKPVKDEELNKMVLKIQSHEHRKYIECIVDEKKIIIPVERIEYISSDNKYTYVNTDKGKTYCVRKTLRKWEEELPKDLFCKINRSFIIHYRMCDESIKTIHLPDGITVEVSRLYRDKLRTGYRNYLLERTI